MKDVASRWVRALVLGLCAVAVACEGSEGLDVGGSGQGLVRGRVVTKDGSLIEPVTVAIGDVQTRTDAQGTFEVRVPAGRIQRVRIESGDFAGTEISIRLRVREEVSIEIGLMRMKRITIPDAEAGGRLEGDDGFVLDLPERSLRRPNGDVVRGEAELRYALVDRPELIRVAPELRITGDDGQDVRLRSESLIDVRFYQREERLAFEGEARTAVPLPRRTRLSDGDRIDKFHYDSGEGSWERMGEARIEGRKWVARLDRFSWWTVGEELDSPACMRAELLESEGDPATQVQVFAEGADVLWLSSASTDDQGLVCLEAPRDVELRLSSFLDDGRRQYEWLATAPTSDATGLCTDEEARCVDLGVQRFKEAVPPPVPEGGTPGAGDGGSEGGAPEGGAGEMDAATPGGEDAGGSGATAGTGGTGGDAATDAAVPDSGSTGGDVDAGTTGAEDAAAPDAGTTGGDAGDDGAAPDAGGAEDAGGSEDAAPLDGASPEGGGDATILTGGGVDLPIGAAPDDEVF